MRDKVRLESKEEDMETVVVKDTLREFIFENFLVGLRKNELNDTDSFLEKGIIDSTGVLELVAFVEQTFGFEVEDEELLPDNFDSLNRLQAYIERKSAGQEVHSASE
jgi:acyl carrier protein